MKPTLLVLITVLLGLPFSGFSQPVIYVNQVGFGAKGPRTAIVSTDMPGEGLKFTLVNIRSAKAEFSGLLTAKGHINEWMPGKYLYCADFSSFRKPGKYKLVVSTGDRQYSSPEFLVGDNIPAKLTLPAILNYYHKQRANTPQELEADRNMLLYGSDKKVDIRGGWCDASGDVSKYFSHLAYANFMSPQQIPLVTWSMADAVESIPRLLDRLGIHEALKDEAVWGADYIMRSLSPGGYFYMTVFSYFNPDPKARRIVGLEANSKTTADYQCAFREGGGMAIAALARISQWKTNGDSSSAQYLRGAEKAFAHLLVNNKKYADDGKENIIDDYCALMAATELWIATGSALYRNEARKRAANLGKRMTPEGYFLAGDGMRPFWHASDAGLPVIALVRYLAKETGTAERDAALEVIKKAIDYNLRITAETDNPFGYARQSFLYKGSVRNGFFIPHENETGWWWQGENARLGSLAAAVLAGGRLVYPKAGGWGVEEPLAAFAGNQISWILGCNPWSMCFMYGLGQNNVPYMKSMFGHGSEKGGISNGITGKDGNPDGSGIDFKTEANGNEWRWTEQWIPHAAWFLQAITAISIPDEKKQIVK